MSNIISFNSGKKQPLIKPVSVLVKWSESKDIKDETTYDFLGFEWLAFQVALTNPEGSGYDKTQVIVTFDNDDSYECRLDLSCNCDAGFLHHLKGIWRYFDTLSEDAPYYPILKQDIDFAKKIDFSLVDLDTVNQALAQANEFEKEREKQEAEKKDLDDNQAFNEEIERLQSCPDYSHLEQFNDKCQGGKSVAKNIRKDLKKYFKGVKFSVRSTYSKVDIDWQDGPTILEVDEILKRYKGGFFDGMQDIYETNHSPFNCIFGAVDYVFTSRSASDELIQSAIDNVIKKLPDNSKVIDVLTVENYRNGHLYDEYIDYLCDDSTRIIGKEINSLSLYNNDKNKPLDKEAKQPEKTATPDCDHELGIEFTPIQQTTHSKKGHDLFVVVLAARVEYEVYEQVLQVAKEYGGYYSSFKRNGAIAGFQFLTEQAASDFINHFHHDSDEEPAAPAVEEAARVEVLPDLEPEPEVQPEQNKVSPLFSEQEKEALNYAANILASKLTTESAFTDPTRVIEFCQTKMVTFEQEVFSVLMLNSQHELIACVELSKGTIDSATVYPREVVKSVLAYNAAAVILAHNHPSGNSTPSTADKRITERLKSALALIDVQVLDHIVVGLSDCTSFANMGLL